MPKYKIDACFTTVTFVRREVEAASADEAVDKVTEMAEEEDGFWDDAKECPDSAGDTYYDVFAGPCEIRWCRSGLYGTRRATECIDDGAWTVSICQQCFDALGLEREGATLPRPSKVRRLVLRNKPIYTDPERDGDERLRTTD